MYKRPICFVVAALLALASMVSSLTLQVPNAHADCCNGIQPHKASAHVEPLLMNTATAPQGKNQSYGGFVSTLPGPKNARPSPPIPHTGATRVLLPGPIQPKTYSTVNFHGDGQTTFTPSDSNAAAGPYNVIETVNSQWAIYGRDGRRQYGNTFKSWFSTSATLFDPKVVYEPRAGRFIFLVDSGTNLYVSISRQNNAFGYWCSYIFPTSSGFADFPQLGVGVYGVFMTANIYNSNVTSFVTSELFSLPRTQVEQCTGFSYTTWTNLHNPGLFGSPAFSIVPAVMDTAGGSDEYLVNSFDQGACSLTLWKLTGTSLSNYSISTLCYSPSQTSAAQPGTSAVIAVGDNRLYQADFRNGLLDVALTGGYNWGNGNVTVIWWFKINTNTNSTAQSGGFGSPGVWFFYPGFAQDANGNGIFIYDVSSTNLYPGILYIGLTTSGSIEGNTWLISGSGNYTQSHWGDYQSARLDPTSNTQIWICGQYAAGNDSWGTQIGQVAA